MSFSLTFGVKRLHPDAVLPTRAHESDAGLDISTVEDFGLWPAQRKLVPTGIALEIPEDFAVWVTPRSGLAHKHGITIVNSPGLIDTGYRGEIMVNLRNSGNQWVQFKKGDRIAQLVPFWKEQTYWIEVDELTKTERGEGGHGSSGVAAQAIGITRRELFAG